MFILNPLFQYSPIPGKSILIAIFYNIIKLSLGSKSVLPSCQKTSDSLIFAGLIL